MSTELKLDEGSVAWEKPSHTLLTGLELRHPASVTRNPQPKRLGVRFARAFSASCRASRTRFRNCPCRVSFRLDDESQPLRDSSSPLE
jgi:hypothetical protein